MRTARTTTRHCDICRKPTNEIVAKLFYTPLTPNGGRQYQHSKYSHHADVGVCCGQKLLKLFQFQQRQTAEQYRANRKAGK
jgi:hypothetical protein